MVNLLIFIAAVIAAFRITAPLLLMVLRLVTKLISFTLFIAVAILAIMALLTHGAFI